MGARQKTALRPLSEAEQQAFQRVAKASSERVDTVKRAKALLSMADGKTFTQAGVSAGLSHEGSPNWWNASTNEDWLCWRSRQDEAGS